METTIVTLPEEPHPLYVTSHGQPYSAHQTERYERYQQVVALRDQGVKLKEIAKRVGLGVRTVQRWVAQDGYVETNYHHKHRSRYDRYADYSPFAQVASPFPFFQWRKRLYGKNSPKEMTEDKIGDILGLCD